jgi:hypothetical protein
MSATEKPGIAAPRRTSLQEDTVTSTKWRAMKLRLDSWTEFFRFFSISPGSTLREFQMYFVLMVSMEQVFVVPVEVAFQSAVFLEPLDTILDVVALIFYGVDMFLRFHTAYYDDFGHLVMDQTKMRLHYLKTQFVFDFIGSFPFERILGLFLEASLASKIRLLRFIQVYRWWAIVEEKQLSINNSSKSFFMAILALTVFAIFHWFSCFWWMIELSLYPGTIWATTTSHTNLFEERFQKNPTSRYLYVIVHMLNGTKLLNATLQLFLPHYVGKPKNALINTLINMYVTN